ncbi:MAG: ATP-binding cassette domain-containing protein [Gammaproteobacteria bacterium]|nr:ATP-binding cassette domain-containing protein [Gammaproteobacteria bacterium]
MSNHLSFDLFLKRGNASHQFKLNMQGSFKAPITAICGASGAGKSTLLTLFAGLLEPMHGFACLNDDTLVDTAQDIFIPPHLRHIGLMWQDGQLFPHLSVRENLLYGYHLQTAESRRFSPESVIELLEIEKLLNQQPRHLSGGERQRVALGRTLLSMPRLLLLDEPLNALNYSLKQPILQFLKEVPERFNIPLVYVTHQMDEAKTLGAETWMCEDGKLFQV